MKNALYFVNAVLLLTCPLIAYSAQDNDTKVKSTSSMNAYSGVFNTPTAETISYGDFSFNYSDNFFADELFVPADDLKFGVGILPNVEVVARLSTETWHCNGFTESGCGFRDLSGAIKWQIPFIPKQWFSLAVGAQDFGGAAVYSESYYLTASKEFSFANFGAIRTSLGVASSDNQIGYMDGVIGSIEYQPIELLQVAAEYDANAVNVGVKTFAPTSWLPNGWDVYLSAQLYSSDSENNENDVWYSAGINVPLGVGTEDGGAKANSALAFSSDEVYREEILSQDETLKRVQGVDGVHGVEQAQQVDAVELLASRLADDGFESISIGNKQGGYVIRVENNVYNRNEFDAVARIRHLSLVALGDVNGVIEISNSGVVSFAEPLRKHSGAADESENDLFASNWADDVKWLVKDKNSTHFIPRVTLAPELKSLIGTEYGAFDYEFALSTRLQMSLWDGGVIELRHLSDTIARTDDFEDGQYYQRKYGLDEGIDTRLFHQTFALPFNVFTKFSFGRIYGEHDGVLNESRWASTNNTHRLTTLVGEFENTISVWGGTKKLKQQPKLIKYRYRYHPFNWDIELTAGEYWHGDKGYTVRSLHWFNNVQVGVRYKRTKFDDSEGGEEEDFIALGFSIPLSFGKSMNSRYGQVRGTEQWDYYVQTNLQSEGNANTIRSGFGKEPSLYHNLNRSYFNRDRF